MKAHKHHFMISSGHDPEAFLASDGRFYSGYLCIRGCYTRIYKKRVMR